MRKGGATKSDEFSKKIQTAFPPILIFGKLYCNFFIMDMVAYADSMKCMHMIPRDR